MKSATISVTSQLYLTVHFDVSTGTGVVESNLKVPIVFEDDEDTALRNAAIDGLESLVLSHACAGVDISTPEYQEGVLVALGVINDNYI